MTQPNFNVLQNHFTDVQRRQAAGESIPRLVSPSEAATIQQKITDMLGTSAVDQPPIDVSAYAAEVVHRSATAVAGFDALPIRTDTMVSNLSAAERAAHIAQVLLPLV